MNTNTSDKSLTIFALLTLALSACAEVAPPIGDAAPRDVPSANNDATVDVPGMTVDVPNAQVDVPGVAMDVPNGAGARVVINEIRAETEDWIELVNVGTATADLGGWGVTDSENDGDARVAMSARFPAGTTLAPASYLLIVVDQVDGGVGPQMRCLMSGGPMTCYHGPFGISAGRGESVHLVNPAGVVTESANYPMNAAMAGESWGRIPNGTGVFVRNRLTPGAANQAM